MILKKNRQKKIETLTLSVVATTLFAAFFRMFYYQSICDGTYFVSDLIAHIGFATSGRGYSALYTLMGFLINLFNSTLPVCFLGSIIIVATWLTSAKLISITSGFRYFTSAIIALPLLVITGIFIPFVYQHLYRQQLITQPYHNITYYGMRLFAVISMTLFYRVFDKYLNKINVLQWICLSIALALSTSIKPSFFYGFALVLLIFLIIDFFKTRFKAKPTMQIIFMGLVVVPSLLIMLSQYNILYKSGFSGNETANTSGIALIWGANFVKNGIIQTFLKLFCNVAFPCLVICKNRKKLSKFDKFSHGMFLVQLIICILFTETGRRATHGNFYWGLYIGAYFMFMSAITLFIKNVSDEKKQGKIFTSYTITGFILLAAHLLSSLLYFGAMMLGKFYSI